jgi:hypothetical protein
MTKSLEILVIIFSIGGHGFLFQEATLALAQPMNPLVPQQQVPQQQVPQQQVPQQQVPQQQVPQQQVPQQQVPQQQVPQQQVPQQQVPQQQPLLQPQLQPGQPLYNPIQVVACLNHVLVDSIVKAGTTTNWTLHNNSKGVAPELNQTFIQNATQTLDSCIVPISR